MRSRIAVLALAILALAASHRPVMAAMEIEDRDQPAAAPQRSVHRPTLSTDRVRALEQRAANEPADLEARSLLLRHYFLDASDEARAARTRHITWIVENSPEVEIAGSPLASFDRRREPESYQQVRGLWLRHVQAETGRVDVLFNAARFFAAYEQPTAAAIMKQLVALDPGNDRWHAMARSLGVRHPAGAATEATPPGPSHESIADGTDVEATTRRYHALARSAQQALDAGENGIALAEATGLLRLSAELPRDWNFGNAVHEGNRILGHLALQRGDVQSAKEYLLKSGATFGSPQLNSFGPPLTLADELLRQGETSVVIEYLQQCSRFWKSREPTIRNWIERIQAGERPKLERFDTRPSK
jgi:hypothetical protein